MSTSSIHRITERGGGGGGKNTTAAGKTDPLPGKSLCAGNENPSCDLNKKTDSKCNLEKRVLDKTKGKLQENVKIDSGIVKYSDNYKRVSKNFDENSKTIQKLGDEEVQEMDDLDASSSIGENCSQSVFKDGDDSMINDDGDEFDDEETVSSMLFNKEEGKEKCKSGELIDIGNKNCSGGWFVFEGASVLLAHADCSCSFYYDIANSKKKAVYKPPAELTPNMWRDCWIIEAPDTNGWSNKYVVAASSGNSIDYGFCSWDFYTEEVQSYYIENNEKTPQFRNQKWWYKPCGKFITSTATCQKTVQIFDIRNGDQVMKWDLCKPVLDMDFSSPLHWRNKGLMVLAESNLISTWDVNSLSSRALMSVSSSGQKITALHVNNADAELGGGVRQRIHSRESQGNDGVFCTLESINVLDFRVQRGIGLTIPILVGVDLVHSAFSDEDSIYLGCTRFQSFSQIQHFSMRMPNRNYWTYSLPEPKQDLKAAAKLTQVWGNSRYVMGVCGLGLFVFDTLKDHELANFAGDGGVVQKVKEVIGPYEEMYIPSFDYLGSKILLISRDRPALWRYLL